MRDVPTNKLRGEAPVANVIAIANQKGGVGKTTTAINLGGALAEQGYRVLCIDMDPQANLTVGLGINLGTVDRSVADVLADSRATMTEIVIPTQTTGIDVAPATLELASTEVELFSAIGREHALREALDGWVDQHYDFALIDCPPTLGLLTINALVAARSVIIPVQTQYYALKGLTALVKVINTIRAKLNRELRVLGLLPTFYDGRTILGREMLDELRELGPAAYGELVRAKVGARPVFVSFDIDFLDPAFAPGTGTPEVGGFSTAEALAFVRALRGITLVGCDVVEVSPSYDGPGMVTALAGATVVYELLSLRAALNQ